MPADVAEDPDRLARFRREALLLASLNHPNIAAVYGLEDIEGAPALVLELVSGEELAARIARGPLPIAEALEIARQVAEGLEEAHENGILHRDLKPANVKRTAEGRVKILDFGLAKAFEAQAAEPDPSLSPTWTAAGTQAGVILGTAAYMSPEQARGAAVDKRTDVWAFGCLLMEMLTGERVFAGDTVSDTLAAVLRADPDWAALPAGTPPALEALLRRCLDRDRRRRLRDIGEARIALEGVEEGASALAPAPERTPRSLVPLLLAIAVTASLTALAVMLARPGPEPALEKLEFSWPNQLLDTTRSPVLSPDGRRILFATADGLAIRSLDSLEPLPLSGTAGASFPTWSPDGSSLAFLEGGSIWRMPSTGGETSPIATGLREPGPPCRRL